MQGIDFVHGKTPITKDFGIRRGYQDMPIAPDASMDCSFSLEIFKIWVFPFSRSYFTIIKTDGLYYNLAKSLHIFTLRAIMA
jgi:hypothetical protein